MWYRIELDPTGAILKCEEAGEGAPSGKRVRYIEARNKAEACSLAKQWWALQLHRARESKQRLRSRRLQEGRCSECETLTMPGRRFCPRHAAAARAGNREARRRRRAGVERAPSSMTPEERFGCRRTLRVGMVLREFDSRGPELFRAWLISYIERGHKTEPKAEAAE